ncbi:RHS repeat-associated core domain-containing protein, partial [Pseudoalteromonas luteoviolacea]|uniref:RHS repeat-associated core domain-containing protein n=1 Tax=Pseudoalteromonas luteoviolacea TaxID=43657 RepID=UPI000AC83181
EHYVSDHLSGLFGTIPRNLRSYTGHEPVALGDDNRILHMNGRVYDVDTGRVMQADPIVQAPMNLQNYNAYSYVLNNPLSYTDPSGYLIKALHNLSKKINRQFIRGAAKVFGAQVVSIVGNILSGFCGPAVGVCAAAWNYEFTRAMGGSPSQALKAGVIGGLTAQAFYEIGQHFNSLGANNLDQFGSVEGAKAAGLMEFGGNMLTGGQVAAQITSHALVGGVSATASGGKFGHGFISAGVTKGAGGAFLPGGSRLEFHQIAKGTVISAVIGGTVSEITGGKFANGARTGAMQFTLNQVFGSIIGLAEEQVNRYKAARRASALKDEISRLEELFTNDLSLFRQEMEFFGFEGSNRDLGLGYISLRLNLERELAITNAAITDGSPLGVYPKFSKVRGVRAMRPDVAGVASVIWPYIVGATGPDVGYNYNYKCSSSRCRVIEFNTVDWYD